MATSTGGLKSSIRVRRVYDPAPPNDGLRILIDRLWPRGLTKRRAHIDSWIKELAPSTRLRKWFGHRPERWDEFQQRYAAELRDRNAELRELRRLARRRRITLLFSAHDEEHNNAVAFRSFLIRGFRRVGARTPIRRR